jgi:hypothetical protein
MKWFSISEFNGLLQETKAAVSWRCASKIRPTWNTFEYEITYLL